MSRPAVMRTRRFSSGILKTFWKLASPSITRPRPSWRPELPRARPWPRSWPSPTHSRRAPAPSARAVLDQARLHQAFGIDHGVGGERAQRLEVHDRVVLTAAVRLEAALGQPAVERHLPALEATVLAAAGARIVALVALGRRLPVAGSRPASHALAGLHGPRRRPEA